MGKVVSYARELEPLLRAVAAGGSPSRLRTFLLEGSRLPGLRANLELAAAFAHGVAARSPAERRTLEGLCRAWAHLSPVEAPRSHRGEFLAFCAVRGLGALGAEQEALPEFLSTLRCLAQDPRWRIREAVAMALQDLLATRQDEVLAALDSWVTREAWLEMRAVAAALAEPRILAGPGTAARAREIHGRILAVFASATDRDGEPFRVLRRGLAYTLSVVVAAQPREGWPWLRDLAESADPDVRWVLLQNLRKNRLRKDHAAEAKALESYLGAEPTRPRGRRVARKGP